MKREAFTLMEVLFVIVLLGILAAVAVPRLSATRTDAEIAKGKADVSSIRSSILTERQSQVIRGVVSFIPKLTENTTDTILFRGDGTRTLLTYGIKEGAWQHTAALTYTYTAGGVTTTFTYTPATGIFTCTAGNDYCDELTD
ncbi:type II secretion system protein [Sulfurimonas sp.]|uniref:type II secretion system protein n=1 Tax=Sulfurimonas sp. TaxID=2022749 RepID=UPI003565DDFB